MKVIFSCDHEGCEVTHTLDTTADHVCGINNLEENVPIDLSPVVNFLMEVRGWDFMMVRLPDVAGGPTIKELLLFEKCFCPEHKVDAATLGEYRKEFLK